MPDSRRTLLAPMPWPRSPRSRPSTAATVRPPSRCGIFSPRRASSASACGSRRAWLLHLAAAVPQLAGAALAPAASARARASSRASPMPDCAQAVKAIEAVINHDVKAVEYYVRQQLAAAGRERGVPRARAFRLHLRGHQQSQLRAPARARRAGALLGTLGERIAELDGPRPPPRGPADAGAHPRPARQPDDARQGSRQLRRAPAPRASGAGARWRFSANGTAPSATSTPTMRRCPASTGRR